MWIRNTSRYPNLDVRFLLGFAASHVDVRGVQVNVKNSRCCYAGRAYPSIPSMARANARARYLVVIRVGAPSCFPCTNEVTSVRWVPSDGEEVTPEMRLRLAKGALRFEQPVVRRHPYGGVTAPLLTYADWREALVGVAAHEFCHVEQYRDGLPVSEIACERAALTALECWRDQRAHDPR